MIGLLVRVKVGEVSAGSGECRTFVRPTTSDGEHSAAEAAAVVLFQPIRQRCQLRDGHWSSSHKSQPTVVKCELLELYYWLELYEL